MLNNYKMTLTTSTSATTTQWLQKAEPLQVQCHKLQMANHNKYLDHSRPSIFRTSVGSSRRWWLRRERRRRSSPSRTRRTAEAWSRPSRIYKLQLKNKTVLRDIRLTSYQLIFDHWARFQKPTILPYTLSFGGLEPMHQFELSKLFIHGLVQMDGTWKIISQWGFEIS